jgi:S1-C subfamily serine protease
MRIPGIRADLVAAIYVTALSCSSCESEPSTSTQGNGGAGSAALLQLKQQISAEEARLDEVQQLIEASETRATKAEAEANYQQCRASATELEAEAQRRQSMCAKEVAEHNLCVASNIEQTGKAGVGGCALGILVATLTGGAGAWALGGCAVGLSLGAAAEQPCPIPTCALKLDVIRSAVLTDRGRMAAPRCGGYAGLMVAVSHDRARTGVRINRISPGTYAQAVSMAAGDVLLSIANVPVDSRESVVDALSHVEIGALLRVEVVRRGDLFELEGRASRNADIDQTAEDIKLGVELGETVSDIEYERGLQIASVDPQGPAASFMQPGDRIVEMKTPGVEHPRMVRQVSELESMFVDVRPNEPVTLTIRRGAEQLAQTFVLGPRQTQEFM